MPRWQCWRGFFMRFTIHDMLLLMMVVALSVGWWVDRSNTRRRIENAGKWFELSIDGEGYFPLADQQTESVVYTRSRYVSLNELGQLITPVGTTQWLLEPTIRIPLSRPFSIQPDGRVFVRAITIPPGDPPWSMVGQLSVAVFARPDKLRKVGPGLYAPN